MSSLQRSLLASVDAHIQRPDKIRLLSGLRKQAVSLGYTDVIARVDSELAKAQATPENTLQILTESGTAREIADYLHRDNLYVIGTDSYLEVWRVDCAEDRYTWVQIEIWERRNGRWTIVRVDPPVIEMSKPDYFPPLCPRADGGAWLPPHLTPYRRGPRNL